MADGRRWTVVDSNGNPVYLTHERWEHICQGHPEMGGFESAIRDTVRKGRRRQEALDPRKYRYRLAVPGLPGGMTHIEVVVLFRIQVENDQTVAPNNYVATAYLKQL